MSPKKSDAGQFEQPSIRVAPLGELKVYMVQEHELDTLAHGSTASLYLNFSLSLLSISASFFVVLLSTPVESIRVYNTFVIIFTVTLIIGLVLLAFWRRDYVSTRRMLVQIKSRMPAPPGSPIPPAPENPAAS